MVEYRARLPGLRLAAVIALGLLAALPTAAARADAASTLVAIDTPRGGASSTQLYVSGWAADPRSASGPGVDRLDVYLDGERDGGGTPLGRKAPRSPG